MAAASHRAIDRVFALLAGRKNPIVLIDGPSGAGKSTFADELITHWPVEGTPTLIRMDWMYPGWDGLEPAAEALARDLLVPLRRGEPGFWHGYDWERGVVTAATRVEPGRPLVIEGCGTLGPAGNLADLGIWIDAEDTFRKARALARDGEGYVPHWDAWQADFEDYVARWDPRARAGLLLRAEPDRVVPPDREADSSASRS
ncbi:hypothetical protein [Mycetocola saprophilus]|uniref:hypothetical protein n=1 Tax=Mycetocola saprophilus TaxID=76636 RepID=UPI0006907F4B|nr:hypothetical protein [Mycetocola saprophilus]